MLQNDLVEREKIHPLARKSLENIVPYIEEAQTNLNNIKIRLSDSENPYGSRYCRYPNPNPIALKEKYINYLKHQHPQQGSTTRIISLRPENLLFCNGSDEGIDLLIRAFCEPKIDNICILSPTFPMYAHWAKAYDIGVIDIPLKGKDFDKLDIDRILQQNSKLLFICNPNNPVGNAFNSQDILTLIEKHQGLTVIDEAYHEFSHTLTFADLITKYPNLVVLHSFSKAWGLAGIRGGLVIANQLILNALQCIKPPFSFSIPAQEYINKALNQIEKIRITWRKIIEERERLKSTLEQLPCISYIYPSISNFLLVEFKNYQVALHQLSSNGILIRNSNNLVRNTLRISIGTREQNNKLLKILALL